jgi:hypothetical protein
VAGVVQAEVWAARCRPIPRQGWAAVRCLAPVGEVAAAEVAAAVLQRKGKDPIHPERVLTGQGEGRLVFVFLFSRTGQPIELQDKEVTFLCSMGPAKFKTKFSLKDMVFDGKLDL